MSVELDHWLTKHRDNLLARWASDLAPTSSLTNSVSLLEPQVSPGNTPDPGSADGPEDGQHEAMRNTLTHLYDGVIQAARGNLSDLDSYLDTIIETNGQQNVKLHDLIAMSLHLRRLAWDVVEQDVAEQGFADTAVQPAQVFGLMKELDTLLEHTTQAIARSWEQKTESEIQERISQAEFIAESMSAAIEQADRTALQLSSLNEVSQRFASSLEHFDQLIEQSGSTILDLLGIEHVAIWLPLGKDIPELYAVQTWGKEAAPIKNMRLELDKADDIIVRAYANSTLVFDPTPDPAKQGAWLQEGFGALAMPMLVKERATGVVVMQDSNPAEQLSRSQQNLATGIINQSAIALENARLYAHIRRFNTELEQLVSQRTAELQAEKDRLATIHEISTEISSTLDLDALLNTSLEALARITQVEFGSIMLVETDTGHLVNRAVLGKDIVNTFTRFPIGSGVAGWVAQHKTPALIPNVHQDERWVPLPASEDAPTSKHEGSMVAVPLIAHNEILGVLILSHSQPGYFNDDHLRLLTASAGAIAIGINNANMYTAIFEEMERSSDLLQRQNMEASKMESILQSLSDGVVVCDTYGDILSVNPAAGRLLQRNIEEWFLGGTTRLHDVLRHLLDQNPEKLPLDDLLTNPYSSNDEPRVFESTVEIDMRVLSLTLGPVLKVDGELIGALLLMHDITREVEADRLKTEFIGTMSHELRTPMTAIKGFTQLLAMGGLGPVNDTQREFLQTIQSNAERMISIINDVLDITKIETGSIDLEMRPIHLAETLSGVMSEVKTMLEARQHVLTMNIPPGLPLVRADASRLHQILYNMVSNAIKYTPLSGNITIEAHEAVLEHLPDEVRDRVPQDRRYVQMNIKDTGVGIAPNEIDLIFERFYRTENPLKVEAGGTGLGLSLVKPLIELLGGRIWVESVLKEGSTFSFILPTPAEL